MPVAPRIVNDGRKERRQPRTEWAGMTDWVEAVDRGNPR